MIENCKVDDCQKRILIAALEASCGYLLNARIDLETGCTKATAIRTIDGGLKRAREVLSLMGCSRSTDGITP
jgi:hypothetical protein